MKLRNKKTGEIGYLVASVGSPHYVVTNNEWASCGEYSSLAKLNEEWEDCEEPKEFWYIDYNGVICNTTEDPISPVFMCKQLGNYFESREEAEKAVEKLEAWERLKEKGFKFIDFTESTESLNEDKLIGLIKYEIDQYRDVGDDLELLFGGEE